MGTISRTSQLLQEFADGDASASDELMRLLYDELRAMGRRQLARERPGQTLQPTALVHEVYLRLLSESEQRFSSRRHFFGAAAEAMRRLLVERARRKARVRHGGALRRVELEDVPFAQTMLTEELFALEEVLDALETQDPEMAMVVKLRYHVGMTVEEVSKALNRSPRTVKRQWAAARVWLRREIDRKREPPGAETESPDGGEP